MKGVDGDGRQRRETPKHKKRPQHKKRPHQKHTSTRARGQAAPNLGRRQRARLGEELLLPAAAIAGGAREVGEAQVAARERHVGVKVAPERAEILEILFF